MTGVQTCALPISRLVSATANAGGLGILASATMTLDELATAIGKVKAATDERVKSDERVQAAVGRALARIHALLKPEQRARLAYLLRTGALSM